MFVETGVGVNVLAVALMGVGKVDSDALLVPVHATVPAGDISLVIAVTDCTGGVAVAGVGECDAVECLCWPGETDVDSNALGIFTGFGPPGAVTFAELLLAIDNVGIVSTEKSSGVDDLSGRTVGAVSIAAGGAVPVLSNFSSNGLFGCFMELSKLY